MKRSVRNFWRLIIAFNLVVLLLVILINLNVFGHIPSLAELENPTNNLSTEVYASNGELIAKYYLEDRKYCEYDSISANVIEALVSTEDERFYNHSGIDGRALLRSVFGLITFSKKGGASTLTQQLAKNLFPRESKNIFYLPLIKLKEWILAIKLERNLTKKEILALYLNTVEYSDRTYGIFNASKHFFSKRPSELDRNEASILVGMLNAPSLYNPRKNPKLSLSRRNTVINKMVDNNKVGITEATELKARPLALNIYQKDADNEGMALYFKDALRSALENFFKENKKRDGTEYNIYTDGLKIYTSLDINMQKIAEKSLEDHVRRYNSILNSQPEIRSWKIFDNPKYKKYVNFAIEHCEHYAKLKEEGKSKEEILRILNTPYRMKVFAWNENKEKDTTISPIDSIKYYKTFLHGGMAAIDPITGEVKSYVGGVNYKYFKYDHCANYAKRQVGSVIKPLLYCLAVTQNVSPCDVIPSGKVYFQGHGYYRGDQSKTGPMTMKDGLAYSKNPIAVNLLKMVGFQDAFITFLRQCGVTSKLNSYPSIALGAAQISMIEMLRAYSMFPNKGLNTEPVFFTRIEDRTGAVLYNFEPKISEVISEENAYIMARMMQGTVDYGTGKNMRRAFGIMSEMGGKTGTTNDNADAWFIGYTPQLLAGVWVGADDPWVRFSSTAIGQGSSAAMPVWAYYFKSVFGNSDLGYDSRAKFEKPASLENKDMCGLFFSRQAKPRKKKAASSNTPDLEVTPAQQEVLEKEVVNTDNYQ